MKNTIALLTIIGTLAFATDKPLSINQATIACKNKQSLGCKSLSLRYFNGDGVKINDKKSNHFSKLACEYGDRESCKNYGYQLQKGRGVKKDLNEAFKYYEKACELAKTDGTYKNKFNNCRSLEVNKSKLSPTEFKYIYGNTELAKTRG